MTFLEIAIALAEEDLAEIDQIAAIQRLTRAEFVRNAVLQALHSRRRYTRPIDDPRVREAVANMRAIAASDKLKEWDSAAEIRRWRDRQSCAPIVSGGN